MIHSQAYTISDQIDEQTRSLLPYIIGEPVGLSNSIVCNREKERIINPTKSFACKQNSKFEFQERKFHPTFFCELLLSCYPLIGFTFKSSAVTQLEKELLNIKKDESTR